MPEVEEQAHDASSYTKTYWETPAETESRFKAILEGGRSKVLSAYRAITRQYETLTGQPTDKLVPVLSSLSPSTKVQGAAAFTLTATGSNFVKGSQINWAGQYLDTTFVSNTTLTAPITAALVQAAATVPVKVYTDTDVSSSVTFTITATAAVREGNPSDSWTKAEIIAWLVNEGYEEPDLTSLTKADLLAEVLRVQDEPAEIE